MKNLNKLRRFCNIKTMDIAENIGISAFRVAQVLTGGGSEVDKDSVINYIISTIQNEYIQEE